MAAPTNDNIENAVSINSFPFSYSGTTIDATKQAGEPNSYLINGATNHSVWFVYSPGTSGTAYFNTDGSDFDTTLTVYSSTGGANFGSLVLVTQNDDKSDEILASEVSFSIDASLTYYIDLDGYGGATGNYFLRSGSVTADNVAPTIVLTNTAILGAQNGALNAGDTFTITISLSESVALSLGGTAIVNLSNGVSLTTSAVESDGQSLEFSYTVAAGQDTANLQALSLSLGAGTTLQDASGNDADLSSFSTINTGFGVDTTAPTLAISSSVSQLGEGETAAITFAFSEDPGATFTSGDITVIGGTLGAISGSGLTRTATFTPTANTNNGTASITVAAGAYTDAAGNNGGAGATPSLTFDTKAPTLAITSDVAQLKAGETATITFTFSEDPGSSFTWDGSSGDVVVTGGTLSAISGTGLTRTAVFTPTADTNGGFAGVTVAGGTYTDAATNLGGEAAWGLTFDTKVPAAPSVPDLASSSDTGTSSTDNLTKNTTPVFTGTAEAGSTITLYDTDGTTVLGTGTAAGGNWSITSSALAAGTHAITAVATDTAGNRGAASGPLAVTIDTTAPTLVITNDQSVLKAGETATITFTFSEDPGATFTLGDVTVGGGTLGATSGSGLTLTATFTPTANTNNGTASITVAAGAYTDAAGNDGGAGATPSLAFDTRAPAAPSVPDLNAGSDTGTWSADNLTKNTMPVFTGAAETGSTVALYDTDGTTVLGTGIATGGNWSITSSALAEGIHTITAVATDAAGNTGAASSQVAVMIDTTAPILAVGSVSRATNVIGGHTVSGNLGITDAGLTVTIRDGATVLGTATSDSQGHFSFAIDTSGVGAGHAYDLTASAIDAAGNLGASNALAFNLDFTPNQPLFGVVAHDVSCVAGQVYALYEGLLGRGPDALGGQGWASVLEHGASLEVVTQGFLNAAETQINLNATDNADFVAQLYQTVLGRAADAAGQLSWTQALEGGVSRAAVANGFVFSAEHVGQLQSALSTGVFVADSEASAVARLYYGLLDRAPDAGGLQNFTNAVHSGTSLADVAQSILSSAEYASLHPGLQTDQQYLDNLYAHGLGRTADTVGGHSWLTALHDGSSRANVAVGFATSTEAQQHFVSQVEAGWHLA